MTVTRVCCVYYVLDPVISWILIGLSAAFQITFFVQLLGTTVTVFLWPNTFSEITVVDLVNLTLNLSP